MNLKPCLTYFKLASVVQRPKSTVHWINYYSRDNVMGLGSLHYRRFMSQAGRTPYFARSATQAREEGTCRSCLEPREISLSPRLAHKAPVVQARFRWHFSSG